MSDGACLIFFRSGSCDLDAAEKSLSARGLSVSRIGRRLEVTWYDGPKLRVELANGNWVKEEAVEIAERHPRARDMANCDVRFEILFDDLDEVLDEINTLIEVQTTLQKVSAGYMLNTWNGELSCPGDESAA